MGSEFTASDFDTDFYELCFADVNGIRRSQTFMADKMPGVMHHGFGLTKVVMFLPCFGDCSPNNCSYNASGEFALFPDHFTFKKLPWKPSTTHAFVNLQDKAGNEARECPRGILRRALDKLKQEFDIDLTVGFETEFLLLDKSVVCNGLPTAAADNNYGSQNDMVVYGEVLEEIVKTLKQLGIDIVRFHAESAFGQLEIATGPADPVTACDNLLLTRLTIISVANKHGFATSFLPKFYTDAAGNGCHVHLSLSKNGEDISPGSEPRTLSAETQHFINGILKHQAGLTMWCCGTRNSFERLQPSCWASTYNVWGIENKEANIRVLFPSSGEKNGIHFENKCFDATTNPYVGVAGLAIAGVLGLRAKEPLPPETCGDPSLLSVEELQKREAVRLPMSLAEAIAVFKGDEELQTLMTEISSGDFVDGVVAVRRDVEAHFSQQERDVEVRRLYSSY